MSATKATYRFLSDRRVTSRDLSLCVHDTTTIDFTTQRKTGAPGLQGLFMRSAMAVSVEGVPLGLLGCWVWARGDTPARHRTVDIRANESGRWLSMLERGTAGIPSSTTVLTVADREADIIDFRVLAQQMERPVLVRAAPMTTPRPAPINGRGRQQGEVLGVISARRAGAHGYAWRSSFSAAGILPQDPPRPPSGMCGDRAVDSALPTSVWGGPEDDGYWHWGEIQRGPGQDRRDRVR